MSDQNQTTEPTTETPSEQVAETPPAPGQGALALQTLMQRELQSRDQELTEKKRNAELEEANRIRMLAKTDKQRLFRELGISPEDVKVPEVDPISNVSKEVEQLKSALREVREQEAAKARQAQLENARQQVIGFIEQSEQYPFIKALPDFQQVVFDRMVAVAQEGQSISEHEAAQEVENWLVKSTVPAVVEVLKGNEALMAQFFPEYVRSGGAVQTPQTPLTNQLSTDQSVRAEDGGRKLTEFEEIERMKAMLKFT